MKRVLDILAGLGAATFVCFLYFLLFWSIPSSGFPIEKGGPMFNYEGVAFAHVGIFGVMWVAWSMIRMADLFIKE